ncbi:MAG: glycine cleavage system protein H [Deltaproteobacteria bacterium]|nr:glycine cleavage system protein H [Deltaproteobacteria bacterium]
MDSPRTKVDRIAWLPQSALPCVWMSAGLLSYRLCDRQLDCDHCPLDAALCGTGRQSPSAESADPTGALRWQFPDDRRYHRGHLWAMIVEGGAVRCGLDAFAAELLEHAKSVVLPAAGSHLQQGTAACWLAAESDLIPLCTPVSGTVVNGNVLVQSAPALLVDSPYGEGWLMELDGRSSSHEHEMLLSASQMRERADRQLAEFRKRAEASANRGGRAVGATLADGGERLTDLRRILGAERYRRLVSSFLH